MEDETEAIRLTLKHKLKEASVGCQSLWISRDITTRGKKILTLNPRLLLSGVSYSFLLLHLSIPVLLLLLFLLLVLELLAQVEKFNTLAHALSPHLKHAHTNTVNTHNPKNSRKAQLSTLAICLNATVCCFNCLIIKSTKI